MSGLSTTRDAVQFRRHLAVGRPDRRRREVS
jgi:hypothetical protein